MQIYLARNQVQAGPYTLEQLNRMLASHEVELTDLMWHEGMENWQPVGVMTGNTHFYQPHGVGINSERVAQSPFTNTSQQPSQTIQPDQHSKNTTPDANESNQRRSVADLYGNRNKAENQKPYNPVNTSAPNQPQPNYSTPSVWQRQKPAADLHALAGVGNRILATLLDQVLALLCLVPMLSGIDFDIEKIEAVSGDPSAMMAMLEQIPQHLLMMSSVMVLALLCVQIFMLIKRGQTLGKLVTGIRILDEQSKRLPSITNLILIRTILTNVAYNLPFAGQIILAADFVAMLIDKQNRSLHDRMAKTIVVKAHDEQLTMSKAES